MTREEAISWLRELTWHEGKDVLIYDTDVEAIKMGIKALKQEPCENVVSRKKIDQNIYDYTESNGLSYVNLKNAILDAPKVKLRQRWFPVTEKLPEESTAVLVWCPERKNIYCAYYEEKSWWIFGACFAKVKSKVIAWMPLPEPYNAESEGV